MIAFPIPGFVNRDFRIKQRFYTKVDYTKSGIHGGLDLAPRIPGTRGVVLYAPHEGYVGVSSTGMLGNHIRITSLPYNKKGDVRESLLAHLAEFKVKDGQFVSQGEPIGIMGTTGHSTGIHCHWEYRVNGNLVNVEPYLFVWHFNQK